MNPISQRKTGREDRKQYLFAIRQLTNREIKRKYARSYLGIIWSVLNPLLTMLVMTMVFSYMYRRNIVNYPIYYLTGSIFFTFFRTATASSISALVDNRALLVKVKLPKQTFVIARVYTALVNFGYACIAYAFIVILFLLRGKLTLGWSLLLFPLDVFFSVLFATGIALALSIGYVFFADIKYLYHVLLTLWMYLSAIFYPVTSLAPSVQGLIGFNPVYVSILIARRIVLEGVFPEYTLWVKLVLYSVASLTLGYWIFRKNENRVMQHM